MKGLSIIAEKEMLKDLATIKRLSPKDAEWLGKIKEDKFKEVYEGLKAHIAIQEVNFKQAGNQLTKEEIRNIHKNTIVNKLVLKFLEKYFEPLIK